MSTFLPGYEPSIREHVANMSLSQKVEHALHLIRSEATGEPYYLAFSGGKDSGVLKHLAQLSGVPFQAWYNQTTIDAPELVKFIKDHHSDVKWNRPDKPMMWAVANLPKVPPTRSVRWCCDLYKEQGGDDANQKLMGVRAQESPGRADRWREVVRIDGYGEKVVCPILYWSVDEIWEFTHAEKIPYCSLYDEGFKRLGCVGCPLASKDNIDREFTRWPGFEKIWKKAIIANWDKWKNIPNTKTGAPRYQAKFKTGEEFWNWWRYSEKPEGTEQCQLKGMWE